MLQSQDVDVVKIIEKNLQDSKNFLQKNIDSAIYKADHALRIAQEADNDSLIGKSYLYLSSAFIWKNNFVAADSIIKLNLKKKLSPYIEGRMWHNLGVIEYNQGNLEKALDLYLTAVKILEKSNYKKKVANTYTNMGLLSNRLGQFERALKYYEKSLQLSDDGDILKLQTLVNMSIPYFKQKRYDDFLETMLFAEKLAKNQGAKNIQSVIYNNLSEFYINKTSDYDKAIIYGKKSLKLKKSLGFDQKFSFSYKNIGSAYLKKEEFRTAIKYLDSALPISKSDDLVRSKIYDELKVSYSKLKDYRSALYYADLKNDIKDSIVNKRQQERATELIEKFESEKKELKIVSLTKEKEVQEQIVIQAKSRQRLYLIASLILLFLLTFSIWSFIKVQRQQKQLRVVNQVKNRLFSIIAHDLRGMIIPFQRTGKIMKYHIDKKNYVRTLELSKELEKNSERLSSTLDNLLNWSLEQMDGYKINPEQLSLGRQLKEIIDDFEQHANYKNVQIYLKYKEDIPVRFDRGAFHVIFRNLVGNALKYSENGNITIAFGKKKDELECSVIDQGVGMTKEQLEGIFALQQRKTTKGTQGEKGTGLGLNLVYRFVMMHKGSIKVSSEKMEGTRFDLRFPIEALV